jgi:sortase A
VAWLRACERALFVVAAVALVWYAGVRIEASREQAALSRELDRASVALSAAAPSRRSGETAARSASLRTAPAPRAVVGRLEVPRLHLSVVAREGVDTRTLRGAAGHVPGTALPGEAGNAAFAAHRDTFFAPLRFVRKGDAVTVTTPEGQFHYVVSSTRVVDPDDVTVLDPTKDPTLTLVTCYPFDYFGSAPQRFIVRARLTGSQAAGLQ